MPELSRTARAASQAMSIKFNNLVYEMRARGEEVIVLSLGEAFFDIPLRRFDDLPFPALYHYSHSRGVPELRREVAAYYRNSFGAAVDPERELIITAGSKAAIYFSLLATVDPGDEVLLREPTWVSYPEQVKLCGGVPVFAPHDAGLDDLERYLTPKSKVIILNNPNNPRGEVAAEEQLRRLLELARKRDLFLLFDEAYSDFVLDGSFRSGAALDVLKEQTIVCNSISKNFGISGWRLGYSIASPRVTDEILKINQHVLTCPATILQFYVAKHFGWLLESCRPQIVHLAQKRRAVQGVLKDLGLETLPGGATFYVFVSIAPSNLGSQAFALRLLEERRVCVVPGVGYGASCDGFVRVSIGTESLEKIHEGLGRLRALIDATSGASSTAAATAN